MPLLVALLNLVAGLLLLAVGGRLLAGTRRPARWVFAALALLDAGLLASGLLALPLALFGTAA